MKKTKEKDELYYETKAALWLVRGRKKITNKKHKAIIDKAISEIGADLCILSQREQLKKSMLLNCDDGKRFCYRYLNLPYISESDFYRRKEKFLAEIFHAL